MVDFRAPPPQPKSLVTLLSEMGVDYRCGGEHHHVTGGWVGIDCPFCSPHTGSYKLGINERTLKASCWQCGCHSLYETLLAAAPSLGRGAVYRLLASLRKAPGKLPQLKKGRVDLPAGVGPLQDAHKDYLHKRGLDPAELSELWGVQGIGMSIPPYSWRVLIPIKYNGQTVSWTARSISDGAKLRYITANSSQELLPAKSVLFGADLAQQSILICEGPLDAMRIGPGGVSTLGLGYTRKQLLEMVRFPKRLVAFDSEPRAQRRAERLAKELAALPGEVGLVEIDAKDPGSASEEELQQLRRLLL